MESTVIRRVAHLASRHPRHAVQIGLLASAAVARGAPIHDYYRVASGPVRLAASDRRPTAQTAPPLPTDVPVDATQAEEPGSP